MSRVDARLSNTTRGRNQETSTRRDKKLVPLQSCAVALGYLWLCNPLSPAAGRQKLQGPLEEGHRFPVVPASSVTAATRWLRCFALPVVRWGACPWHSSAVNISALHGSGETFPVILSDPLCLELLGIELYLLINS